MNGMLKWIILLLKEDVLQQNELKKMAAEKAMEYVKENSIVGVGTGSTVEYFIDFLAEKKHLIEGAVASSNRTAEKLKSLNIPVMDLNVCPEVLLYVDGADEFTKHNTLTKGGGGAHTREKIIATVAKKFVCIVDDTKQKSMLGEFPIPVEVIPMARSYVAREIVKLGGSPALREDFTTDNGNIIIDVFDLDLTNPSEMEIKLNTITGVVENGIFAHRKADIILMAAAEGVQLI